MTYVNKAAEYLADADRLKPPMPQATREAIRAFAAWLDAARAPQPARNHSCPMPVREGDEYVCRAPNCTLRWGTDEDKPPCQLG